MQIGEVIRKYRKEKNMTQEEVADCLGVTAPAVNKWEKGVSLPDVMLLAPIARMLGISLDTLLNFQEELTEQEINELLQEADRKLLEEEFDSVFRWAKQKIQLYPNCEKLRLYLTVMLDGNRMAKGIPDMGEYDTYSSSNYTCALESSDENLKYTAADALFAFYTRKEQYEKAEEYVSYFSPQNPERKRKQAYIYWKTNRTKEAWRTYEEILLAEYQTVNMVLYNLFRLSVEEDNHEKAHYFAEKQEKLASLFEMGAYSGMGGRLELSAWEKNAEMTVDTMEKLLAGVEEAGTFSKSPLFEHLEFKSCKKEFQEKLKQNLLECFRDEEMYGFLKDNKRWQRLR